MLLDPIELSCQLIAIPSYSGKNQEVIGLLENLLLSKKFICNHLEYEGDGSYAVNNLHAIFNPNESARTLYFAGHTDVVKEGDANLWTSNPFKAEIRDGKIFGRGAADMKCAIACFFAALFDFLNENPKPNFGIGLLITNDEESDGINGTKKVLDWMQNNNHKITHCLVGEPTSPERFGQMIKIGRRGSISFKIKIIGKQGHVAYPQSAINPITSLINVLKILKEHKFDEGNQFFDATNLEITSISSDNFGGNVIPNQASCAFNIRFNDIQNSSSIVELIKFVCDRAIAIGANYEMSYSLSGEAFLSDPKELAQIVVEANEEICGVRPVLGTTGGTSDARFIKDFAQVVEIGLVNETAHKIDEFVTIDDVKKLHQTYLQILRKFDQI